MLGHEDHPELLLEAEETIFTTLADPLPFHYIVLTDKHLDEQMQPATLVGISQRRAVIEVAGHLPQYANIMLQLEVESEEANRKIYMPRWSAPLMSPAIATLSTSPRFHPK